MHATIRVHVTPHTSSTQQAPALPQVEWGQDVHTEGTQQSLMECDDVRKIDLEAFCGQMRAVRGRTTARANQCWDEFKADPSIGRDEHRS